MIIRKLRLDRGWSQETLAELSGLSARTVQRIERGGRASLESLSALAAVFETDISELSTETSMYQQRDASEEEREAMEYVRDIKGFYAHLISYVVSIVALGIANHFWATASPWFLWTALGWGMGIAAHGLAVFEVISFFGVDWEKRQIEKRLQNRKN